MTLSCLLRHGRALLLAIACALLLAACGFRLRGEVALPAVIMKTYIQGATPYSDLETDLRRALTHAGVQVTEVPQAATAQLRVLHEDFGQRVLTVDISGKAREYELYYAVTFEVTDPAGKVLLAPQPLTLTRDFTFNEVSLLGKSNEQELLHKEMRQEMVQRILLRLGHVPAS